MTTIRSRRLIISPCKYQQYAVIDAGVLPKLLPLFVSFIFRLFILMLPQTTQPCQEYKKGDMLACVNLLYFVSHNLNIFQLSNIAAGIREQVRLIAAEPGLFERVIELMSASEALDIRWIVCNAARGGSVDVPRHSTHHEWNNDGDMNSDRGGHECLHTIHKTTMTPPTIDIPNCTIHTTFVFFALMSDLFTARGTTTHKAATTHTATLPSTPITVDSTTDASAPTRGVLPSPAPAAVIVVAILSEFAD
ncbi:hypothetical protein Pelo_557 [Pelomyxa schiedti]|nr:hypothetical protein Pelo_557 [Pelomyxa schiedti]